MSRLSRWCNYAGHIVTAYHNGRLPGRKIKPEEMNELYLKPTPIQSKRSKSPWICDKCMRIFKKHQVININIIFGSNIQQNFDKIINNDDTIWAIEVVTANVVENPQDLKFQVNKIIYLC